MIYCRGCQKDVDPNDMDESIYISDIFAGQPVRAMVIIDLACSDCENILLEGNGMIDLYG